MPVAWHYLEDDANGLTNKGPQVGPVNLHQIKLRFWSREISYDTLVWRAEFPAWKPLQQALPDLEQHAHQQMVSDNSQLIQLHDKLDKLIRDNEWLRGNLGASSVGSESPRARRALDWEKEQVQELPDFLQVFTSDQNRSDKARSSWKKAFRKITITNALRKGSKGGRDAVDQTAARRSSISQLGGLKAAVEEECMELMQTFGSWNVDVFKLQIIAKTPLALVGYDLIATRLELLEQFSIGNETFCNFLHEVECGYPANPYHGALHGADAALSVFYFLEEGGMRAALSLSEIQVLAVVLAALVHDLGHVGVNNQFLSASRDPIALTYNDRSNLENFHIASFFKIICKEEANIFARLEEEEYRTARRTMIEMVLATDMAQHFKHVHELQQAIDAAGDGTGAAGIEDAGKGTDWASASVQELVCGVALHAADISNPVKEWELYEKWTVLVMQEFHSQGGKERAEGVSIKGAGSFATWDKEVPPPPPLPSALAPPTPSCHVRLFDTVLSAWCIAAAAPNTFSSHELRTGSRLSDLLQPPIPCTFQLGFINFIIAPLYKVRLSWCFSVSN
jgi:hypothetical protein